MTRTRIKICGITRPEDGLTAANLGADAIGLVFYPRSARYVDISLAQRIAQVLPPFIATVGLFVDAEAETVHEVLARIPLHLLQFHGAEDPAYCASFGQPFIKAVPMEDGADVTDYARRFRAAAALLLDSHGGTRTGGSGHGFDWTLIPSDIQKPIILAGGLNPDNVAQAVKRIRPFAVDVSSGVESAKGIKVPDLMQKFITGVESGDNRG